MGQIPQKASYKLSEVCRYTDTQPYVLRFWESEFPQLSPEKAGTQRTYTREDLDLVQRIKHLLYEEKCTLAGAREKLESETGQPQPGARSPKSAPKTTRKAGAPGPRAVAPEPEPRSAPQAPQAATASAAEARSSAADVVSRRRYEDAVDEIGHLRLQVKEAEKAQRKAEAALEQARQELDDARDRTRRAGERLTRLLQVLEG